MPSVFRAFEILFQGDPIGVTVKIHTRDNSLNSLADFFFFFFCDCNFINEATKGQVIFLLPLVRAVVTTQA